MSNSGWLWLVPILALSLGSFAGCGGSSGSAAGSGTAGISGHGGSAGRGGSAGTSHGGGSAGRGGNAGTSHSGGGTTHDGGAGGEASFGECDNVECGPQLGLPNWTCADGSLGGPTGRCLKRPGGTCGWEINDCPIAGEGGSPSQGGQGGAAADECGGCSAGKICVFQVGGPGAGRFICATQNPCGSAAACACIVAQGTCQPDLMGDPPGYCSCDNGLD